MNARVAALAVFLIATSVGRADAAKLSELVHVPVGDLKYVHVSGEYAAADIEPRREADGRLSLPLMQAEFLIIAVDDFTYASYVQTNITLMDAVVDCYRRELTLRGRYSLTDKGYTDLEKSDLPTIAPKEGSVGSGLVRFVCDPAFRAERKLRSEPGNREETYEKIMRHKAGQLFKS